MVENGILDPAKGYKKCITERNICCIYTLQQSLLLQISKKMHPTGAGTKTGEGYKVKDIL